MILEEQVQPVTELPDPGPPACMKSAEEQLFSGSAPGWSGSPRHTGSQMSGLAALKFV